MTSVPEFEKEVLSVSVRGYVFALTNLTPVFPKEERQRLLREIEGELCAIFKQYESGMTGIRSAAGSVTRHANSKAAPGSSLPQNLRCLRCGNPLIRRRSRTGIAYYRCENARKGAACSQAVRAEALERVVARQVRRRLELLFRTAVAPASAKESAAVESCRRELLQTESRLTGLSEALPGAQDVMAAYINRQTARLQAHRQILIRRLSELGEEVRTDAETATPEFPAKWETLDTGGRLKIAELLIAGIKAGGIRLEIEWKL